MENYRWPTRYDFDYLGKAYHYAIEKSGGLPVGLFNTDDRQIIENYLDVVDGMVFTGGPDINSKYYNQRPHPKSSKPAALRDNFEINLIKKAVEMKLPIFCICRGHQLLNIALGGTLYQDLKLLPQEAITHAGPRFVTDAEHYVKIKPGSLLYSILKKRRIMCNSSHHQVINKPGAGLTATAWAPDNVIEALELDNYPFLISIQWHPERIFQKPHSELLFKAFMAAASGRTK